jgi:hypothetical protein
MTRQDAERLLRELDDLAVRVRVQEARLVGDPDIAVLRRDVQTHRERIIDYLAACQAAGVDATIH